MCQNSIGHRYQCIFSESILICHFDICWYKHWVEISVHPWYFVCCIWSVFVCTFHVNHLRVPWKLLYKSYGFILLISMNVIILRFWFAVVLKYTTLNLQVFVMFWTLLLCKWEGKNIKFNVNPFSATPQATSEIKTYVELLLLLEN